LQVSRYKEALDTLAIVATAVDYRMHPNKGKKEGLDMSDDLNAKAPTSFYIIGGIFFLWNFTGLALYYQQMTMTPEVLASFGPVKAAFIEATPVWANAAYATAVTVGLIASVFLLLRKAWALPAFIVSFVAVLIQDLESFVIRDVVSVFGSEAFVIPPLVIVIAVAEIWYSKSVANRYYR
jgi:hypothetical protein